MGGETNAKDSQNLIDLTVKRSSIKGQITKFKNYISQLGSKDSLTPIELAELSLRLGKFESLSTRFDDLQNHIEILNPNNLTNEIDERDDIEQLFITNIALAQSLIQKHTAIDRQEEGFNSSQMSTVQTHLDHQDMGFKLPHIQIAKFDGCFFRWLEFRDTFLSMIHNNERIAPIHKFHYLISYLTGDAARVISNFEVSSANYNNAWRLLCDRYDNKRQLINHHLNSLLNIQQTTNESKSLRFLVDHVTKNLRALSTLGQPTSKWDTLIIHIMSSKLDNNTRLRWEEWRGTLNDYPDLEQFYKFLIDRADVLDSVQRNYNYKLSPSTSKFIQHKQNLKSFSCTNNGVPNTPATPTFKPCLVCHGGHRIYDCPIFKAKSVQERIAEVNRLKLCTNCLRSGHAIQKCLMGPCRVCKGRHNSLLHEYTDNINNKIESNALLTNSGSTDDTTVNLSEQASTQVLLSTAFIEVVNPQTHQTERVRALLDCGSQSSFITQSLKNKLSLSTNSNCLVKVFGIGDNYTGQITETCVAELKSLVNNFTVTSGFLVLPKITGDLPRVPIDKSKLQIPNDFILADPKFYQPAPTDVLIGADLFWDILGREQHYLGPNYPKLRSSQFGWIVSGPIYSDTRYIHTNIQYNYSIASDTLEGDDAQFNHELTKFWELEEVPLNSKLSESEKACEAHYKAHTSRLGSGRFSVGLPLKDFPDCLGQSYTIAKTRLLNLEKRFKSNPQIKAQYVDFIREYSDLGHLSESPISIPQPSYFLSHHCVFKESESTKIRVVFDGSTPTSSGYSVNDLLRTGPNIQDSLFSILIRARLHKYLLTGDIEKMYRQILVNENDRDLQLILWREHESMPIKTFRLNTVTYGMASSSYLSTRCLWQLGEECSDSNIKQIIQHDFYIDDLITGASDESTLHYNHQTVTSALQKGCFNLRKFKSNLSSILDSACSSSSAKLMVSESTSTLGVGWNPSTDQLHFPFKIPFPSNEFNLTKRMILSSLFKIFDPLGLLSPCVVKAKIIMQQLWLQKVAWDEIAPSNIQNDWYKFAKAMSSLNNLQVPRRVLCNNPILVELHSFIATIPRLELCAALLAAKLCKAVRESLRFNIDTQVHWCDSSIVLGWLHTSFQNLKPFFANRISEICELTNPTSWRHVPTADNPADLISRGVDPDKLRDVKLWWSGPIFLSKPEDFWPVLNNTKIHLHKITTNLSTNLQSKLSIYKNTLINFENYSNIFKLKRTFAYLLRFIHNSKNKNNKLSGPLTVEELNSSFINLCRLSQQESFLFEYNLLACKKSLSPKCSILSLSPFYSNDRVIRVGGRLQASDYDFDKKHPVLLHATHHFTKILFEYEHKRNLHAGPHLLLATVREYVWPINGRNLARRTVRNCFRCRRLQGKTMQPMMGNLPSQRITPDFPFKTVGLDFAGPFLIVNKRGRGAVLLKCYLCLFVCLRYKCVHLEAVTELSKDAFIMTFHRFVSRRGKLTEVFCDNGRNFVAGAKEINTFLKVNANSLSDFASENGIKFLFSPTYAPHFGGIFEAGVKSAKFHVKRVMGNTHLTYEELSTLFTQVEAILNSRPLCPLSSSPDDFLCLTPGHFLIGRALTSIPSPALEYRRLNNLQRYERLQQIHQHFWRRWQHEYIAELEQRHKWKTNSANPKVGDLVVIREDNVPPLHWKLGRISKLFYGPGDSIARVADVATPRGGVQRLPLVHLCLLPTEEELAS